MSDFRWNSFEIYIVISQIVPNHLQALDPPLLWEAFQQSQYSNILQQYGGKCSLHNREHQLQLHFLAGFSHSLNYQYHMHSVKGFVMVHIKNIKKSNAFGQDYLLLFISRALTRTSPLPCTKAEKFEDSVSSRQSVHHSLLNFVRISSATFLAGTQTLWEESVKLTKNSKRNLEGSNWWILQPWIFSTVHMLSISLARGDNLLGL